MKTAPPSGQTAKRSATVLAAASVLAMGTLMAVPAMATVDNPDPEEQDTLIEETLVKPNVSQPECFGGHIIGPSMSGNHSDGVTYVFDASQIAPGATVTVTAMPADGYVLADADDWTMLENGEATYDVVFDDIDCEEGEDESPEPETPGESEGQPTDTEEPADENEDADPADTEEPTGGETPAAAEQQLEETGAPVLGLLGLTGLATAAGAFIRRTKN